MPFLSVLEQRQLSASRTAQLLSFEGASLPIQTMTLCWSGNAL
jgi:hypothetical protein